MQSLLYRVLVLLLAGGLLTGCSLSSVRSWLPFGNESVRASPSPRETSRPRTRHAARPAVSERACLASGRVRENRFIRARSSLGGPARAFGGCGAYRPFEVKAFDNGRVQLTNLATLRCQMVPAMDRWTRDVLAPAAMEYLGSPVRRLRVLATYACRPINSQRGNKLSEHGRANAIDIGAFELADGRLITVKRGWRGSRAERLFLRRLHQGACRVFTTVLGPDANRYHHDHFHFDLARHGRTGTYRVCR